MKKKINLIGGVKIMRKLVLLLSILHIFLFTSIAQTNVIGSIKVIPENISISDPVLFVIFAPPFSGGCTHQFSVDSIIDRKIYISGKYDSNNKCGDLWDKEVNDTINIGFFPVGVYEIIYTFIDINQYGATYPTYPTEIYNLTFVVSAQITQEQADEIVLEHLSQESASYSLFAKEDMQENMIITTSAGEAIELDYACWVYYISYGDNTGGYLIVNENNGNLLEINPKSNAVPNDLAEWRVVVPIKIPLMEFSLADTSCQWKNLVYEWEGKVIIINSNEELENYIECIGENYPAIDFLKKSLLVANGMATSTYYYCAIEMLMQLKYKYYAVEVDLRLSQAAVIRPWQTAIVIDKIEADSIVDLKISIKD